MHGTGVERLIKKPRVRFAPSPTGHLHVGSLRVALFNYLYARHHGGTFLVRIEDTDRERSKQEYTNSIIQSLLWADIKPDEPLVIQTERASEHVRLAHDLVEKGLAYCCTCPPAPYVEDTYQMYNGTCRSRIGIPENVAYAVRLKVPRDRADVAFHDLIRGTVTVEMSHIDDFIIVRSDQTPVYNFVVVADDIYMSITHVIRGEDHISNTPKQVLIYEALEAALPEFAHLPLILGASGVRLSKRDAATAVLDYKRNGYVPDALCNYLVRLGWAYKDQEIFSRNELIRYFDILDVGKNPAIFDLKKLNWVNSHYLKQKTAQELFDYACAQLDVRFEQHLGAGWSHEQILLLIELYKVRVSTLQELIDGVTAVCNGSFKILPDDIAAHVTPQTVDLLQKLIDSLSKITNPVSDVVVIKQLFTQICTENKSALSALGQPVRIALTGSITSPGVFELIVILGIKRSQERIEKFMQLIKGA